ncbi:MAG: cation-translocating P-type ATPase [Candidatus Moranbacteria bacterium]|nr:cation-translocating P-type ATPase [Candidatus Moranbacteria bacterium]
MSTYNFFDIVSYMKDKSVLRTVVTFLFVSPWQQIGLIVLVGIGFVWQYFFPEDGMVLLLFAFIGGLPTLWAGLSSLIKEGRISIDTFNAFALVAAYSTQESSSAGFIVLMLQSASILEWKTKTKSQRAIEELLRLKPHRAVRERDGVVEEIATDAVREGDVLIVKEGERVPVDGVIVSGVASIDESSVTGESALREKVSGEEVLSITVVLLGHIRIRATHVGKDSTVERMATLIREAEKNKSHTHRIADRFAGFFLPGVLVGGLVVFVLFRDISMVIAFFLVACADDIAVSIPLAVTAALGRASRRGVIVKGGKWLEVLARVKTVILDKTGTLTYGEFGVRDVHIAKDVDEDFFWIMVASAEHFSAHPIAKAVYHHAVKKVDVVPEAKDFVVHAGTGVTAWVDGRDVAIGDDGIVDVIGVEMTQEVVQEYEREKNDHGQTTFLVYIDKTFCGVITVSDMPKVEARQSIQSLRERGIGRVVMLTGDNEHSARDLALQMGITDFQASLLPEDKVTALERYTHDGPVAMVGDGINDAPVLSRADVGIAMGGRGTAVAVESANIVVLEDDLSRLPFLIQLGRKTLSVIRWNIAIWVVTNLLGFALVIAGVLDPVLAALYNLVTDFLPLINSVRLFEFRIGSLFEKKL